MNYRNQRVNLTVAGLWVLLAAVSAWGQTYTTTVSTGNTTAAFAAAVNLATNKVYVANAAGSNAGSVTVIDGATNSFVNGTDSAATNPVAVAVNSLTNEIYVANKGSNNVTVIDGSTDTKKATIAVGNAPIDVAVNPQTNMIYVANQADGTVSVINGMNDTVTATLTVGSAPVALAVNPATNLIYVANSGSTTGTNYVSVINGSNDAVTQITDSNGSGPTAVAVNPVTNTAYVANSGSSYVTVITGTAAAAASDILLDYTQVSLAVNPVTNQIFVTCGSNNAIYVINVGSIPNSTTISLIQPDSTNIWTAVAVDPVNNMMYATDIVPSDNPVTVVTVVSGATHQIVATISDSNANGPNAIAINPVTHKIYVPNLNSYNVTVIDGATYATTTVTDSTTDNAAAVAVNPVTHTAYVANGNGTVTVITGATLTTDVAVGSSPNALAVNPVTNLVYVANFVTNNVSVINGASPTQVPATISDPTPNVSGPNFVAVNPVTNTIYVTNSDSANVSVFNGTTYVATMTDPNAVDPYATAVNPVTNTIYVANYGDGSTPSTVSIFAGDTNTLIAAPVVGIGPSALVVNPKTNMIYVANYGNGTTDYGSVSVISGASNTVVGTVVDSAASGPYAIDVNTHTNMIYVANSGQDTAYPSAVTVINGATNTYYASIDDPYACAPTALAVNPASNKIYVANEPGCTGYPYGDGFTATPVTVIDGTTNSIASLAYALIDNTSVFPSAVAVDPTTGNIYVADSGAVEENSTTVIAEQQVTTIPISTTVTQPTGNDPSSSAQAFNFATSNTFTTLPTTAPIDNLLFRDGTWQLPWQAAANQGSGNFTGSISALQVGPHVLYAFASDGEEATSTNTGSGTGPLIGNITAYPFWVAAPEASFSPGSLTFLGVNGSGIPIDTTTPEQTVTLTNNGSVALTVTAVALSDLSDFAENGNCVNASIIPGGACTIDVTFTPIALGSLPATLNVTDNSGDVPGTVHQIALAGTAVQVASTTTVTPSVASSVFGQSVTFTTTVTPNTPLAPTGTVTFTDGAATLCSAVTLTSGQATCTNAALAIATHSIAASYTGDTNFTSSSNSTSPLSFGVSKASSSVGVTSSANPSVPGQAVTFTATVTAAAPGAGTPTGSVTFNDGTTGICTGVAVTSGQATCPASSLAMGQHSITAVYIGDSDFLGNTSPSYSQTVSLTPTTTKITVNTPNPSVVGQPVSVSFTVAVSSPGTGTIPGTDTVTVTDSTGANCTATVATGTCSLAPKAAASDTLTATFSGDVDFASSASTGVNQTVTPAATTTAITSTSPSAPALGQPLTISYTVTANSPSGGTIPGSDTVTVTDGTGATCTGTVATGSCALTPKMVGADTLTATYNGDANFSKSTGSASASAAILQGVNLSGLSATTSPDQPTTVGVALNSPATGDLTGTLTLSFASNASGTGEGYIDPATCFINSSNQCVTQLNFTIPAGASSASLPNSGTVQQGTTAGTITVTLTALMAGTTSVLPQPAPTLSVVVAPLAPVIKSVSILNQSATGFSVQVTAYSTPRDLANATFNFVAAAGTDLNGSTPPAVTLGSTAQTYFASASGAEGGGTFVLTVPFTFSGNTSALGSVTVGLSNSVGASSTATQSF